MSRPPESTAYEGDTFSSQAYRALEAMIVTLALEPGSTASESELATRTGFGRTPTREALARLAAEGLVTALPRRGMLVASIDLPRLLSVIETRKALDRIVVAGAAKRATPKQRLRIQRTLEELSAATNVTPARREGGAEAAAVDFLAADFALDQAIWDAAPNTFAVAATRPLHSHCRRLWFRYREDEDLHRSEDLHRAVVMAILDGEPALAMERSDALMDYLTLFTKHTLIAG